MAKKSNGATSTKQPPAITQEAREVIYPDFKAIPFIGTKALTVKKAKEILGWENEESYSLRILSENPDASEEDTTFGDRYTLNDFEGNKICCWNNLNNRPLNEQRAYALAYTILNSGPNLPKEQRHWQLNGETIIIGKTGLVLSAQHRLIGLILASQIWDSVAQGQHWQTIWETEPTLESLVVVGVEETPEVLRSLDNVLPRSGSDVLYTSPTFADLKSLQERKECSRMLSNAAKRIWQRVYPSDCAFIRHHKYLTNPEIVAFVERHQKLSDIVRFIFNLNRERQLTLVNLSPSDCAALCYLMAVSTSDVDTYLDGEPPSEYLLNFKLLKKAKEFFKHLAETPSSLSDCTGDEPMFAVVRALQSLIDPDEGSTGRPNEKLAILSLAWEKFLLEEDIVDSDLTLEYTEEAIPKLALEYSVGGIDHGIPKPKNETRRAPNPQEIKEEAARIREEALEKTRDKPQEEEEKEEDDEETQEFLSGGIMD